MAEETNPDKERGAKPQSPPTLVPPDATASAERRPSRTTPLLIMACGLLLIIAALLVLLLPVHKDSPSDLQQAAQQAPRPVATQPPPKQSAPTAGANREIEQLVGTWLQKQAEAEAANVAAWGGEAYTDAVALSRECDRLLQEQQNLPARQSCAAAIGRLDDLMAEQGMRLEAAVAAGLQALEGGDPEAAAGHFHRALAIDGEDQRAAKGARRAEQLPAVLRFLQDGLAMEMAGDRDGALLALTGAAALDPDYRPAQQALDRVRTELANQDFQRAMSLALQAMAEGRLSAARAALQKAGALRPGDPAVADLKQQLARVQLAGRLTALRQEAERLEGQERWPEALKSCETALGLDPQAAFAAVCKRRTSLRIDLDQRLRTVLASPERLFEDGPLDEARRLLEQATAVVPRGPTLAGQTDQLHRLITRAETKVEVVIRSDGLTDVTVYHVGRLGAFQEKRLVLRTGDYTATGSRNGFRDVRQTFKVRPASGKMVFTLRCEEPI